MATNNPTNYFEASRGIPFASSTNLAPESVAEAKNLSEKLKQSTTGGCGTSFTTATDPKNINVEQELAGNLVKVATLNDEGDTQYKIITSDGKSITFAEDGSIIFTTAKRNDDPSSGRFDVASAGSTRFKIGEALLIEVGNKNNVVSSKKGGDSTSKAMSIVVYGNVDITSHDGEINARAKNISLLADNQLTLKAGSKIELASGEGTGENTRETAPGGATKEAKRDYGGTIELKTGDLVETVTTKRATSSVNYTLVSHDGATLSTQPLSNYGFQSPGSFTLDVTGDYHEKVGGKKRTTIGGNITPKSLFPLQSSAWLVDVTNKSPSFRGLVPNAFTVLSKKGGVGFDIQLGDIDLYTKSGYWGIGNLTSYLVAIDKAKEEYPNIIPGVYLESGKGLPMDIYSAGLMTLGGKSTTSINGASINITAGGLISLVGGTIDGQGTPSGIFLN